MRSCLEHQGLLKLDLLCLDVGDEVRQDAAMVE